MPSISNVKIQLVSAGDSYAAYGVNRGSIVPVVSVFAPGWTSVQFWRLPAGQAGTSGLWNGFLGQGNYIDGFTAEGVWRDRMNLAGLSYARVNLVQGAIGGTLIQQWAVLPGEDGYSGKWDPIIPAIQTPPPDHRVVVVLCGGANDVLAYADQTPFADTATWNVVQNLIRASFIKVINFILTLNPDAEIIIPSYVNFFVDDVPLVPGGPGNLDCALGPCPKPYPTVSNAQPIHRMVFSTASFGFAKQSLGSGGFNGVDLTDTWIALTDWQYLNQYGPPVNRNSTQWGVIHDCGPGFPCFCGSCWNPASWQLFAGGAWPGYAKNPVDNGAFRNMTDENVNQFFKGLIGPVHVQMDAMFDNVLAVNNWTMFTAGGDGPYRSSRQKNSATTDGTFSDFVHLSLPAAQLWADKSIAEWLAWTSFIEDYQGLVNFQAGDAVVSFTERFAPAGDDEASWADFAAADYVRPIRRRKRRQAITAPQWSP